MVLVQFINLNVTRRSYAGQRAQSICNVWRVGAIDNNTFDIYLYAELGVFTLQGRGESFMLDGMTTLLPEAWLPLETSSLSSYTEL